MAQILAVRAEWCATELVQIDHKDRIKRYRAAVVSDVIRTIAHGPNPT